MTNKILIFTTRQMCYHSAGFFAAQLMAQLENMGYICEMCEFDEEAIGKSGDVIAGECTEMAISEETEKKLEYYIEKEYAAVIDFNSKLPRLIMEDGSYYLDYIQAPFYNYILDNPLYHHANLECRLKRYNVILPDKDHCEYVKRHYPHITSVIMQPLGASEAVFKKPFEQKEESILFMGTYRNPDIYLEQIRCIGGQAAEDMQNILELMLSDSSYTMENALRKVLAESGREVNDEQFALLMNHYYLVEMYFRNYYREQLITTFINGKLPVKIIGDWWENYKYADNPHIRIERPVAFDKSFDRIAAHAVLADSSPFFKSGVHDRVFAGMANYTAVMTDSNQYIRQSLAGKGMVCEYPLNDKGEILSRAEELLLNRQSRKEMTEKAYAEYKKCYTWKNVAENIVLHFPVQVL